MSRACLKRISPACLLFISCACGAFAGNAPRDAAEFFPEDTLVYIGWSNPLDAGDSGVQLLDLVRAGLAAAAAQGEPVKPLEDGLELLEIALKGTGGIGLLDLSMDGPMPDVQIALVIDAGGDAARIDAGLRRLLTNVGAPPPESAEIEGVQTARLFVPGVPVSAFWGLYRDRFFLTLGEAAARKVVKRIKGEGASLADSEELKFDRRKVKGDLDTCSFAMFVDVRTLIAKAKGVAELMNGGPLPPIVDQVIDQLGIGAVRSKYVHCDRRDGTKRTMMFAHVEGPFRGLLSLWHQKPLDDEDLRIVPKNAFWMKIVNVDLTALWKETLRVVAALDADAKRELDEVVSQSTELLGFSIPDELLPVFGDTFAIFDAPQHGGLFLTGTVLAAEVKDAAALQGLLGQIVERLAEPLAEEDIRLSLRTAKRGRHTIHHLVFGGIPAPVSPAWGFANGRWVLGLTPQTVAVALQQVDPATRGDSILDRSDFVAARVAFADTVQGAAYFDWKYLSRWIYPICNGLRTAGLSMAAGGAGEIDFVALPTLREYLAGVSNSVVFSHNDKDGVLLAQYGSASPFVLAGVALPIGVAVGIPSFMKARASATETVVLANLRDIGMACAMYAADNDDKFPDSLEQLIELGLVTPKQLQAPWAEDGAVSVTYVAGQAGAVAAPARSILAYVITPKREHAIALFPDAHVERLLLYRFKNLLAKTYERLGRKDELPEDLRP